MLAALVSITGDLQLAEDVLQEALIRAMATWPERGVPANPRAWLVRAARNAAIDQIRRRQRLDARRDALVALAEQTRHPGPEDQMERFPDRRLELIFTCCHPALALEARVALTLRTLGGLSTEMIARAFLVPVSTMAQRLVRAKRKIAAAGIPYTVPSTKHIDDRLVGVRHVIYLIFSEGYGATTGARLLDADLAEEALYLGRLLVELRREPETVGLLALMSLHHARAAARTHDGELVLLEDQDRTRWDQHSIADTLPLVEEAMRGRGPYAIQAAIAALHCTAPSFAETDWAQIEGLYRVLMARAGTPVVALNHAVALAMAHGDAAGLARLDALAEPLARHHLYHAARGALWMRIGRLDEALLAYRTALEHVGTDPERRFILRRIAQLDS